MSRTSKFILSPGSPAQDDLRRSPEHEEQSVNVPQWMTFEFVQLARAGLGLPDGWEEETDEALLDQYHEKECRFEDELREGHFQTLSVDERTAIQSGNDPNESHYAAQLERELHERGVEYVRDVDLGFYHGGELVLTIILKSAPAAKGRTGTFPTIITASGFIAL